MIPLRQPAPTPDMAPAFTAALLALIVVIGVGLVGGLIWITEPMNRCQRHAEATEDGSCWLAALRRGGLGHMKLPRPMRGAFEGVAGLSLPADFRPHAVAVRAVLAVGLEAEDVGRPRFDPLVPVVDPLVVAARDGAVLAFQDAVAGSASSQPALLRTIAFPVSTFRMSPANPPER